MRIVHFSTIKIILANLYTQNAFIFQDALTLEGVPP